MADEQTTFLYSLYEQLSNASNGVQIAIMLIVIAIVFIPVFLLLRMKKNQGLGKLAIHSDQVKKRPEVSIITELPVDERVASVFSNTKAEEQTAVEIPDNCLANILIVEDDNIMLWALRNMLKKSGYNLVTAKDGKEAFEQLESGHFDVVVTDLMMPYANGLEVVSKIRNDNSKRNVSIIVCSSVGNDDTVTEAFRLGADDYLKKPIKAEELLSRIKSLLDKKISNPKLVIKKTARIHV